MTITETELTANRVEIVNKRWSLAKQVNAYQCIACIPVDLITTLAVWWNQKKIFFALDIWFNMLLSFYSFGLLISFASFTTSKIAGQKHHKVRHKHNSFNLRGNHVNEIREAFDQYRSVLQNTWHQDQLIKYPQIKDVDISDEYDEPIDNNLKFNSWESSRRDANKQKAGAYNHQQPRLVPAPSSDYFLRNKRIYTTTSSTTTRRTTTTLRSIDNDDYDYDDDNDTSNRRLNDDAQVDSVRPNRDVSFLGAELIKVKLSESSILWSLKVIMLLKQWFMIPSLERGLAKSIVSLTAFLLRLTWVASKLS